MKSFKFRKMLLLSSNAVNSIRVYGWKNHLIISSWLYFHPFTNIRLGVRYLKKDIKNIKN